MDKITLFYGRQNEAFQDHWLPITYSLLCSYVDREKVEIIVIDERIEKENTWKLIETHVPGRGKSGTDPVFTQTDK